MFLTKTIKIEPQALRVISRMTWEDNGSGVVGKITDGQLDRTLYSETNKGLEALGGKWNRKLGGHVFTTDPRQQIEAMLGTGTVTIEKDGFFRTPRSVVERIISHLSPVIYFPILEPSAGDGAICDVFCEELGMDRSQWHVLEKNDQRNLQLKVKGYPVVGKDFLQYNPRFLYNTIVMNPPFEVGQDIDHITHAFNYCLAEGGRLVSVVSEGPFFREDKKSKAFRSMVEQYGYSEQLPKGSFKESGTGVNARLLFLRRPIR